MTIDCFRASRTSSGSNNFRLLTRRGARGCSGVSIICIGVAAAIFLLLRKVPDSLPCSKLEPALSSEWDRPKVVGYRSERGDRQEQKRTHDYDRAEQTAPKGKAE